MKATDEAIIVEQEFQNSVEEIWRAITVVEEMRHWYFKNIHDFEAELGYETEFEVFSGERRFPHHWIITEAVPFEKLSYTWNYEIYPGDSISTFEIVKKEKNNLLKVSCIVLTDFPEDVPEFKRDSCIGAWNYFIKDRLKKYLENK